MPQDPYSKFLWMFYWFYWFYPFYPFYPFHSLRSNPIQSNPIHCFSYKNIPIIQESPRFQDPIPKLQSSITLPSSNVHYIPTYLPTYLSNKSILSPSLFLPFSPSRYSTNLPLPLPISLPLHQTLRIENSPSIHPNHSPPIKATLSNTNLSVNDPFANRIIRGREGGTLKPWKLENSTRS